MIAVRLLSLYLILSLANIAFADDICPAEEGAGHASEALELRLSEKEFPLADFICETLKDILT